jgi:hypothetical protein
VGERVIPLDLPPHDGPLKLAERREHVALPARTRHDPLVVLGLGRIAANLELMPTVGAFDRRSAPTYERVVELILGLAPLALNVHGGD